MRTAEAIEALERRADFLANKIAEKPELNMHRERTELGALRMAIRELELRRQANLQRSGSEVQA